VDSDQLAAAVIATEKMLNAVLPRRDATAKGAKQSRPRISSGTKGARRSSRS
jgi:hypothetical protein